MLIPHGDNKWAWDDGPVCDTKETALASASVPASVPVADGEPHTYIVDTSEVMTIDDTD